MRSFLISDNKDTLVAMRLAGIDGVILHERQEVLDQLDACIRDTELGIVILTERIFELIEEEATEMKKKLRTPLIVEIPDRFGSRRAADFLSSSIGASMGIKR